MSGNSIFYSFPKQKRLQEEKYSKVGPGNYEPNIKNIKNQNPKWSFGTQRKIDFQKQSKTPAPNKYNIGVQKNKKMGKFGSSKRSCNNNQSVPGPGNYQIPSTFEQNIKNNKGTSLYFKHKNKKKNQTPGPGNYDTKDFVNQNKLYNKGQTIPKFNLTQNQANKVGPGDYCNEKIPFSKIKGGAMTKELRQKQIRNDSPGPGTYDQPTIIGQEGVKSLFQKQQQNDLNEKEQKLKPGPGQYDVNFNSLKPSAPAFKFGTQQKNQSLNQKGTSNIGPTSYNIKNEKQKKGGYIGKDKKQKRPQSTLVPGPGQYDTNKTTFQLNRNIGNFFKSKNFQQGNKNNKYNVGPGQYNPQVKQTKKRPQSCKFTTTKKNQLKKNQVPSPSKYNPKIDFSIKKNPAFKFGTEKKLFDKKQSKQPCPGTYDIKSDIGKKQRFFFAKKYKQINNMNVPSPGQYEPNIGYLSSKQNQSIGGRFTKDKKLTDNKNMKSPCPTQYQNISLQLGPGVKFGKDPKLNDKDKMQVPGPGQYISKNLFEESLNKNKGFSMTFKSQQKAKFVIPGPGTYNLSSKNQEHLDSSNKKTNNVIFSKSQRFGLNSNHQNIGPGSYDTGEILDQNKKNTKNTLFGKDSRFKENIEQLPGPNQYKLKSKFNEIPSYVKDQLQTKPIDYQFFYFLNYFIFIILKFYIKNDNFIIQLTLTFKKQFLFFFFIKRLSQIWY